MAERKAEVEAKQTAVDAEQRKAEDSFENVARRWWEWWSGDKSPRHAASVTSRLEADVFPAYGHRHIDQFTPGEIRNLMLAVVKRGARDGLGFVGNVSRLLNSMIIIGSSTQSTRGGVSSLTSAGNAVFRHPPERGSPPSPQRPSAKDHSQSR
jgi:hypothetical protein